jgi:hypothetical protein
MKAPLVLFFVSIFSVSFLNAQNKFIQPGAKWTYLFNNYFIPPVFNVTNTYLRDSIMGADTVHILQATYTNRDSNGCLPYSNTLIKQKGDTIFFKNRETAGTWSILYNFATPPGQNWVTNFPASAATTASFLVTVDSVKTVTINGVPLRQLKVRYFNGPSGVDTTYITERIGCHHYLFNFYGKYCETDQPWFKEFICYSDNSLGFAQIGSKPCSYRASVPDLNSSFALNDIQLTPNPATDRIHISSQHCEPNSTLLVCDALGKKILEQRILDSSQTAELETNLLPNGIYFLQLVNTAGAAVTTKFAVVH